MVASLFNGRRGNLEEVERFARNWWREGRGEGWPIGGNGRWRERRERTIEAVIEGRETRRRKGGGGSGHEESGGRKIEWSTPSVRGSEKSMVTE